MTITKTRRLSSIQLVIKKITGNRAGLLGTFFVTVTLLLGFLAPVISPYNPRDMFQGKTRLPPSEEHLFGTDTLGRDVLSLVIWGIRNAYYVGLGALLVELIFGLTLGAISGYFGGWTDRIIMRIADVVLSLPVLILMILAISMFETAKQSTIIIIMGFLSWPWPARVLRSEILSLREREFVEIAKGMGASSSRILFRHLLPNALAPIIVLITIDMAGFILWEASLAFLGLGDPSALSLGIFILSGKNVMLSSWWISAFPGLIIFLITLSLNLFGDGLRDALDVRS
jgi:ABC-type dipeptide/oligopeptide/nickel transport system permease subunit